ncbi:MULTISPECIES: Na/Pi cotransporter family protein [unclassified Cupriavidus]|uniref:Na/Pi cotransporter family protein n=1 Tax=unclassified Cupriavidus TaxID=2640874 RepID=UPI001C0033A1|nr:MULTISPECIES: Na/Pi cotransporter family protein [unclassified Cupriavidus]MCA3182842.1 Na/Pi cotransporter family protein [Cupriavidus sp.]MCA3189235.1 Na/Pi cotransporter family protein [Cupriavidus sp.]MCA3195315.1 Na/Pi cotransporter family protein [Cupriavidus sp.]MCA3200870.1 Na/Pi cotransporter family protein [Cupriavidus sp.]QWE95748.1 Na/Pi cotransporter family protein [Cupriavidus sp. EM10]
MQPGASLNLLEIVGLLVGGLALFLYGLDCMTGGLKAIAGARLQSLLGTLTASRWRGVLAGAGITALLNSSTITTVLLVGFVSAGLMTLAQSIPVIMGANIGSTLTAQIIAFNISAITPFLLGLGFLLHGFAKQELLRQLGGVLLGLGLLFLGIEFMGNATRPLRDFQPFIAAMQDMRNPLLGIVIGAIFTAIVQSSAATLAIVIALGSQGLIPLESGIALILGANVGTCGTALLAAIGKNAEATQVGIVHLLFNVLGVLFFAFIIPQFADFVRMVSPSAPELTGAARLAAETPRQAANAHTVFSVFSTAILIWFTGPIGRLAHRIAPVTRKTLHDPGAPRYLDDALLDMPALGIARVQLELARLGRRVQGLVERSADIAVRGTAQDVVAIAGQDQAAESLSTAVLGYIGQLSDGNDGEDESHQMVDLTRIAATLDAIREVATTSMLALSQRRLSHGADAGRLDRLRNGETMTFATAVIGQLESAVNTVVHPDVEAVARIVAAKPELEAMAATARQSIMTELHLRSPEDVANFRLANDMIEHLNEIARLSRAIAKATASLRDVRLDDAGAVPSAIKETR